MSEPLEGELTRHHNQPFYAQKQQPKFFWGGCLVPVVVVVVAVAAFNMFSGADLTDLMLGFARIAVLSAFILMIFGAYIFGKTRSSLGKGLLLGAFVLLLLLALGLIALFTTSGNALK